MADEVVSETFTVARRRIGDIPQPPLPWLLGVARDVLRDPGLPLSEESYATSAHDGHRPGELTGYLTFTAMRWTDQAPPFDRDFTAGEPEHPDAETGVGSTGRR
ncbi:hypothetical protein [Streptomyces viridosporus]|uniref:hypothetical protein n=1 Tax=Streptomyces viridosporus TaxID=67581 RepID=UPI0002E6EC4E|nr:hypothetical protein [Streptomyces viridosporus]